MQWPQIYKQTDGAKAFEGRNDQARSVWATTMNTIHVIINQKTDSEMIAYSSI